MSEQSYSVDKDLEEAQAMTAALVPYVYEDELYGRVGVSVPSLTPGALLMRLRRLQALRGHLNDTQAATLDQLERQVEAVRQEWSTHYQKKLTREVESRLRDIQAFIRECREDPRSCAGGYSLEALRRTIIQEALSVIPDSEIQSAGLSAKVKAVDGELRRYTEPSDFIWSETLKPIYPSDIYWWLYSRARKMS
jgi:hypothetical protein